MPISNIFVGSLADGLKSRNFEDGQVSKLIAFAKKLKLRGFETGEISKLIGKKLKHNTILIVFGGI